jgi:hypothetical protein
MSAAISFANIFKTFGEPPLMFAKSVVPAALLMVSLAAPAHAMKEPPSEPGTGSSSGGTAVPEPSSMILFGAGAAALLASRRRQKRAE